MFGDCYVISDSVRKLSSKTTLMSTKPSEGGTFTQNLEGIFLCLYFPTGIRSYKRDKLDEF